jgi:hypothetical protein
MARRPTFPAGVRRRIEVLDGNRCAYCRSPIVVEGEVELADAIAASGYPVSRMYASLLRGRECCSPPLDVAEAKEVVTWRPSGGR